MNIDKDIEILKEVQAIFEHLKNHGWIKDITKEVDVNNVIPAISRTIEYVKYAELTKIACCTAQNCEALNNAIRLGKELETKDKIILKTKNQLENIIKQPIRDKNGYYLGNFYILEPFELEEIIDILKGNYNDE